MIKPGDIVYLKTGDDSSPRIVIAKLIRGKQTQYEVRNGDKETTWHMAFELQREKPSDHTKVKGLRNA